MNLLRLCAPKKILRHMVFLKYFEKFETDLAEPMSGNNKVPKFTVWTLRNSLN